jgi:hypothetical protein
MDALRVLGVFTKQKRIATKEVISREKNFKVSVSF